MYDTSEFRKIGLFFFFNKHLFKGTGLPYQFLLLTVNSGQQAGKKRRQYLLKKKILGTEWLFHEERCNRIKYLTDETRESLKQIPSGSNQYSLDVFWLRLDAVLEDVLVKTQAVLHWNWQD